MISSSKNIKKGRIRIGYFKKEVIALFSSISFLTGCSVLGIGDEDFGCKGLPNGTRCMSATDVYWQRHRLANGTAIANDNDLLNNSLASSSSSNGFGLSTSSIGRSDSNEEAQIIGINSRTSSVLRGVDMSDYQHNTKRIKIFTVFAETTESSTGRRYSDRVVMSDLNLN